MDVVEEVMGSNDHLHIVKGKRTKRQRPSSPLAALDMATSVSSSVEGEGGGSGGSGRRGDGDGVRYDHEDNDHNHAHDGHSTYQSPTTSTTEEEEDMANCLIMLAQGQCFDNNSKQQIDEEGGAIMEKFSSRRYTEAPTTTNNKAGYYVYQCKTCSRCFPSFQALGGHRASHKKPKTMGMQVGEKRTLMLLEDDCPPSLTLQMGNTNRVPYGSTTGNKSKVHECSICGSEFTSGQALGGHMRRHRSSTTTATAHINNITATAPINESQEPRNNNNNNNNNNVLSLDLNLPAPEEERDSSSKFPYASKQQSLVFSASSLVDCHY